MLSDTTESHGLESFAVDTNSFGALIDGSFEIFRDDSANRHVLEDVDPQLIDLRSHVFDFFCPGKGRAVVAMGKHQVHLSELDVAEIFMVICDSN